MRPAQPCGLDEEEAGRRLREQGPNELPTSKPRSVPRLLRDIVFEPMFLLLVACGAISAPALTSPRWQDSQRFLS